MIEKFTTCVTPFQKERTVYVHLPEDYHQSQERYPVLYMYDGHNLFEDSTATYGKCWGLEEFLNGYDKPMIVVGLQSSRTDRLNEYCPYDLYVWDQQITGKGEVFMDWFVEEFKPLIDEKYRTIPFRECTAIGGSSMGGLMAYYTVMGYNRWFSKAACLSPSIMICQEQLFDQFRDVEISPDTRVYFSMGTREFKNPRPALLPFVEDLDRRSALSYVDIIQGGQHNEATWETRNQIYMDFLWK